MAPRPSSSMTTYRPTFFMLLLFFKDGGATLSKLRPRVRPSQHITTCSARVVAAPRRVLCEKPDLQRRSLAAGFWNQELRRSEIAAIVPHGRFSYRARY